MVPVTTPELTLEEAQPARRVKPAPWLEPGVFVGALVPLAALAINAARGALGANPIAEAMNQLGLLALIFLIASLACTPMRLLFDVKWPLRLRRMLGLYAFFYACLHFLTYAIADQGLDLAKIGEDISKRPFIYVGLAALLTLVPLAATSTKRMLQTMGARRWRTLHRLAYVAGCLGALHFFLRVKKDYTEPLLYALVLGGLFAVRIIAKVRRARE